MVVTIRGWVWGITGVEEWRLVQRPQSFMKKNFRDLLHNMVTTIKNNLCISRLLIMTLSILISMKTMLED
jgi:hypothetical protein